jgi:hypothetical protein
MNEKGLPTLKICEQNLNYLNYSPRTKENYLGHISRFITSLIPIIFSSNVIMYM